MKCASLRSWEKTRAKFIEVGGNTTQSFGFGRIIGQIYALLYLSPKPLCLDEIVTELGVSKASVSTTIRQLEGWSAVKRVWVKGDRRDFYEAATDFRALFREGVLVRLRRKLDGVGHHLDHVTASLQESQRQASSEQRKEIEVIGQRLRRARQVHGKLQAVLNAAVLEQFLE